MLSNYLKIAWRSLFRNKGFSVTNILGLTMGITCTILIFLWVKDELSFNKFHKNYNDIFQVMAHRNFNNQIFTDENMVLPLASTIKKEIPQLKNAVVTTHRQSHLLSYGDKHLKKEGHTVSDGFFDMFSWKFITGNPQTAIQDAYSLILTESTAKSLFGNTDPINKIVRIDNDYDARVTAVVADVPGNSTFQFDYINTFNYDGDYLRGAMNEWGSSSWTVFIQAEPGANIAALEKKINEIKYKHSPNDEKVSKYFAFPIRQWRLENEFKDGKNAGGMIEYVRMFTIIACIILLIACINFMNLSTSRSEKRAREVGVRKTLGSPRKQLVLQFFTESLILTLIAFVFSVLVVYLLLPAFNTLVNKRLQLDFTAPSFWMASTIIVLFTGLVAGSYPSLYLSSFNPVKVLKGTFLPGKAAVLPRRILVVGQFVISILLISATIVIYQQIQHIRNRDIGYNPNNLIMIPSSDDISRNFPAIKRELLGTGMVEAATRSLSPITDIWMRSPSPDWDGKPENANIIFAGESSDVDFTKTMGIKIIDGKDFSGTPVDSASMLLNKAAVDVMGIKNPVGTQLRYGGDRVYTVIGVTENYVMGSPFEPVDPMMVFYNPNWGNTITLRLRDNAQLQKALPAVEAIFKKFNPAEPFEYRFVDEEFAKKFSSEELISKLINIFAGLAIFICCLGLAGLASFTIEKRIREIGIRKVIGATVPQLLMLISKEFLKLVMIAFVIAVPLTWWLMSNWLQKYTFRINISVWLFGLVGVMVLLLTLVVVSLNTIRAARAKPVDSLRAE
ncbi:ABC transporter permease [Pollutibacter soli]|uniref:ABC transporter permease n=1 Tax=Pollutibacter soli TaxID=3034157 RepID=UPI0030132044